MQKINFSIICPFYNGIEFLDSFIKSFNELEVPSHVNLELVLVDNASDDNSFEVLLSWITKYNGAIEIIIKKYTKTKSSYASRNFGFTFANGDVIGFVDIDCVLPNDYVQNIFYKLPINNNKYLIAGNVKLFIRDENNIYEYYDFILGFNIKSYANRNTGVTANLIVSKDIMLESGGFDEFESGADRNFCKNVVNNYKASFFFFEDIVVFHPCRNTFKEHITKIHRVCNGIALYNKRLPFYSIILYFFKQIIGSVLQVNQCKQILSNLNGIAKLSMLKRVFLIILIFALGAYSRIYLAIRTIILY